MLSVVAFLELFLCLTIVKTISPIENPSIIDSPLNPGTWEIDEVLIVRVWLEKVVFVVKIELEIVEFDVVVV